MSFVPEGQVNATKHGVEFTFRGQWMTYPTWRASYSNESFDRAQALADSLIDRFPNATGARLPAHVYAKVRDLAERVVRDSNAYSAAMQRAR